MIAVLSLRPRRSWAVAGVVASGMFVLAACGGDTSRPTVAEWRPVWVDAVALVPDAETILSEGEELCGTLVGELRSRREELLPAPTEVLENSVSEWLAEAESIGFDCPDGEEDLAERLDELRVLRAEVDAGIDATEPE